MRARREYRVRQTGVPNPVLSRQVSRQFARHALRSMGSSTAIAFKKVLFLDVDGVLNTEFCRPRDAIHATLLRRLGDVISYTGACIVLSSTWRLHPRYRGKLLTKLHSVGINGSCVIADTPRLPPTSDQRWPQAEANRAHEIATWLEQQRAPADAVWAAVDDLDVMQSPHAALFEEHFVRTCKESGLSDKCMRQLCRILGPRSDGR